MMRRLLMLMTSCRHILSFAFSSIISSLRH